ncbi:energy-coupling factor transporter transmembrane component T family protein [Olsenella profusa]|uniref:Energy-coupling factor transporter transmembrane protein EcfT n=1 Tax=Olsenella profusa TaxID=138595 RepID=A0ABS2F2N5_9ACTN|nr:energy-coupling factor transporter transmembrane component T [Olsenella profusa]MBM6774833.1 energy-coupling factor transporter transmembrane protein EcfT [Olsenella profusa]
MRAASGYVWADSPLHRAPAAAKLVGLLACAVLVVVARGWALFAVCAGCAVLVALSRVGWRRACAPLWGMRWFLLLVLVMNALFAGGVPVGGAPASVAPVAIGPLAPSLAGAAQGLTVVVRVGAVGVLGALLTATTRPQQLVDGVRSLLAPLGRLGLTVEPVALAVGVTVQFVPTLLRESRQIIWAQRIRCGDVSSRSIMRRAVSYVRLLVPIFVSAFRRADELSVAMEARGYRLDDEPRAQEGRRP